MIDQEREHSERIYSENLMTLGGIHFTPREIDVLSCLLNAKSTNKIATTLAIFPKTVRTHIQNIMVKLDCNSRDSIIDFVERSGKLSLLGKHYENFRISQKIFNSSSFTKIQENEKRKSKINSAKNKWSYLLVFVLLCVVSGYFLFLKKNKQETVSIRSDLILPSEAVFLNRPELIAQLKTAFNKSGNSAVALVGAGGAGKTVLSRQYVHLQNASLVWEINAGTHESLKSSFENLAHALAKKEKDQKTLKEVFDIKESGERERKISDFVKERLKTYPHWFLIFDNVEKFTDIQKYFPQDVAVWGEGKIILTTRDKNIINNKYINTIIYVNELNPNEKFDLFTKIMNHRSKEKINLPSVEKIKEFLNHIPPFPLDISVASYYLKATNVPYTAYLENLTKCNEGFEKIQSSLLKEAGSYVKTRYNIVTLSLANLLNAHKDFAELLLLVCLLDSQNIPRDLLNKYKTDVVVDNFIHHLNEYSLITNKSANLSSLESNISIHRSTQVIALSYLTRILDPEKNKYILHSIDKLFEDYIDALIDTDDPSKMKSLINHCNAFLSHNNLLNDSMRGLMLGRLGIIHYYNGQDVRAKELLEESLLTLDTSDKSYFTQTATFLAYLGNAYKDLGEYDKAKNYLEKSLLTYNKHLSKNHPSSVWVLIYLGNIYRKLGDYRRAKDVLEKSLFILKENHSEKAMIAWAWQTLAVVLRCTGDYEEARNILENVLTSFKKYNPDHIDIGWILENLGIIYGEIGDYEKAKDILEKSLEIYRKHFSEDYTYVASCLCRLGMIYIKLKEYEKGKLLLEKGLVIFEKNFGKNHIETARIIEALGQLYIAQNNIQMATEYLQKALLLFEMNHHPDIYMIFEDLADLSLKKSLIARNNKDLQQAQNFKTQTISYLKQAIEVIRTHFPEDFPYIIRIEAKLKKLEGEAL